MNNELITKAINAVLSGQYSYCKFLSANDSGETGGHQAGVLISRSAREMLWTDQEMLENHILKKQGKILKYFAVSCLHLPGTKVNGNSESPGLDGENHHSVQIRPVRCLCLSGIRNQIIRDISLIQKMRWNSSWTPLE